MPLIATTPRPPAPAATDVRAATTDFVVAGRRVRLVDLGGSVTDPTDPLPGRITTHVGPAIEAVQSFWGSAWPREITIVLSGTAQQFRTQLGGGSTAQWADIAAAAVADRIDPTRRVATGQRIVFAPGAAAMSDDALRIVLSHELFHYASRVDTAPDAPRWLTEGVADYVARPPTAPSAAPLPTAVPSDADLDVPGPQRSLAYDRGWWFARFVAEYYGPTTLRALYRAACGLGHADLPAAVRGVLGTDMPALLARWQRWSTGRA
ncbi:hypothetical protein [Mycobacterium sp.]|uniref:hypothetical protein n=1 Tax=Mycobacterium sp. TaxID=1785 RepID=UPI0025FBDDE3|nr:hypothetical protein [Mycobacterium sp.]